MEHSHSTGEHSYSSGELVFQLIISTLLMPVREATGKASS